MDYPNPEMIIGGPRAFTKVTMKNGRFLRLPPPLEAVGYGDLMMAATSPIAYEEYRPFDHHFGGKTFSVWVPYHWTDAAAQEEVMKIVAGLWAEYLAK